MRLPSLRVRLAPRPIAHYALLLVVVLMASLGILVAFVFHDAAHLRESVAQSDLKLARQELDEAIELVSEEAHRAAQALAQWDEARQQFEHPDYYAYWRNTRALAAGVLPESLAAVDLYDRDGHNLAVYATDEVGMPSRIDPRHLSAYLVREADGEFLYFFLPLDVEAGRVRTGGYAGLKFDFQKQLRQLRKFRYLDLESVRVTAKAGDRIPLAGVVGALEFRTAPNPEMRALQRLILDAVYRFGAIIVVISLVGFLALVSVVTRPLRRLSQHIVAMRRGQETPLDESYRGVLAVSELEQVRQSLNDYQQQLDDMHVSLADKNQELWTLAHRDPLTGMHNRRAFDDDWRSMWRLHADASGVEVAFLLFDCDHFKAINDTYGHQIGDRVLQGLAQSLHSALRADDRLYRLGGDEFATVLFAADVAHASQVAERCIDHVMRHDFGAYGVKEPVRISVGIAHVDRADDDALTRLHRQADLAMYHAKRPGQGKIAVYTPDMGAGHEALVSNAETSAIYEAMADPDRLEMHYQPVLGLTSGRIEYCEALVRIRSEHGLVMPGSIFPVVELRGLETEFDLAVLERVRRDLTAGRIPAGTGVSLNVSGPGIVNSRVTQALEQFVPLLADYKLVLEVTETALITQIAQASANLGALRRAGFTIALDDFGSGYSSLRYLASMPVDLVKFDISMIRSLEEIGRQAVFVEDLARMIKDAGYALVAEGIESQALQDRVAALGFSHAQGFHIGRPAPLREG
ncbi:MAG: EAL domain-containing protein [Pseudomonadota bacterium]